MNPTKVEQFVGQVLTDLAAAYSGMLVNLGHKLGYYRALSGAGPLTAEELAERTGTLPRYALEWLNNQYAGGYMTYDPATKRYELPDEHAFILGNPESPFFLSPAFDAASSLWLDEHKILDAYQRRVGLPWGEHDHRLFHATEAFFKNGYRENLTSRWIPSLEGVERKLLQGGKVADIGCGHGASTLLMALRYPRSQVTGFDYHGPSIDTARQRAREVGIEGRVEFQQASAGDFPGSGYALICFMDSFHDMGDPLSAAEHCRAALAPGGCLMLVEPFANDQVELNVGPVARLFYAASATVCTPNAVSQGGRYTLGAQAGQARLEAILREAGFAHVRRATETPFNLVLEARA